MDLAQLIELPGPLRLVAGFLLIISIYSGFLGFTYWISKDE
ncbi:MAG: hypothetical protein WA990_08445 [Rubrobacteraceae bacterium]